MKKVSQHGSYLGLPFVYGNHKSEAFNSIIEKCQRCSINWCNKSLSAAGKEVLIKSVLQALPIYMMSCFKFPVVVLQKFQSIVLNFWWGAGTGSRKTHWVSTHFFLKQQLHGGLGFKNMGHFNMALLANQGWRLLQYPDSLVARVLKKKYFPYCDLLSAPEKSNASFVWKSIFSALGILRQGTYFDTVQNKFECRFSSDGYSV